jgi:signal transduction histidine kinase
MSRDRIQPCQGDILIVDDTPDNLRLLSAMLSKQGFEVRKALTGQAAITSALADAPDLILMDIKMPSMSGYEVCQHLKANPRTEQIPVIFISALDDVIDKVKAFAAGGIDYVTKPFQEAEVLARINNQLNLQRLQQQLMEQNRELARSNRELAQFAYVVSHDLQQPLQSITGFAKLLLLKYGANLDTDAHDYLNRITDSGSRMQRLIQDLLTYAQVDKQAKLELIDCNRVLEQVLENLQTTLGERNGTLTHAPLPQVMGNETQLAQLFQNLISNGIKFTRPDVPPAIDITVEEQSGYWLFKVRDHGIGIAAENLERVFEVFYRLHPTTQYPGTGIGLATCKKIVEFHGGNIWVTSELGNGTTFYFTLARE